MLFCDFCLVAVVIMLLLQVVAIAVEINRTEHSNVVTFSPYYPGAMPARIVNACDNYSIIIRQNSKYIHSINIKFYYCIYGTHSEAEIMHI